MPGGSSTRPEAVRRHLETAEGETRRDGATDERPGAERARLLPMVRRDDRLRGFTSDEIGTEPQRVWVSRRIGSQSQLQRRAGVPVPDLHGVDPMPAGDLARPQKEIDRG